MQICQTREQWFMAENENDICCENLSTVGKRVMSQMLKYSMTKNNYIVFRYTLYIYFSFQPALQVDFSVIFLTCLNA